MPVCSSWIGLIPHAVTALRAFSAPLLWWLVTNMQFDAALVCFAFAAASDAIDGPLIRRFGTPSAAGAYFDATADCAVIVAAFAAFAWVGIYPAWTVALIGLVFVVFIVTSRFMPNIYDPVGRHIGGLLFICVGATLLLPDFFFQAVLLWVAVTALAATLIARMVHTITSVAFGATVVGTPP